MREAFAPANYTRRIAPHAQLFVINVNNDRTPRRFAIAFFRTVRGVAKIVDGNGERIKYGFKANYSSFQPIIIIILSRYINNISRKCTSLQLSVL